MRVSFFIGSWLCLLAAPAAAQHTSPYDMRLPGDSIAGCDGPLCQLYNPAGLHWSPGGELLYLHAERWGTDGVAAGGGDGLLLGTDRLGLAVQYVRPDRDRSRRDLLKYNLSLKLFSLGDTFALGGGLEILDPTETDGAPKLDVLLGAMIRPWRYLSLGLVGRNLAEAKMGGERSRRALEVGLALRPLWFAPERLTLAADYRLVEDTGDPPLRLSLRARLYQGIGLIASADVEGGFGVGLAVDLARFGVSSYTQVGNRNGLAYDAQLFAARASIDRRPGLQVVDGRTAVIVLGGDIAPTDRPERGLLLTRHTLRDVELAIRRAAGDPRIDSLLLKIEPLELSLTRVQELRAALAAFKRSGKKVAVHLEQVDNLNYYLACAGDAIYVNPAGTVSVTGPKVQALFFGGTLQLVGVEPEAHKVGDYKSAPEMFTRQEPSPASREQLESLADEFADQVFGAIADSRGLARDQVEVLVDRGLMRPAQAELAGLIDATAHYDELDELLAELLGHPVRRLEGYLDEQRHSQRWGGRPTVAVVHATGGIGYGPPQLPGDMDARGIAELLERLRSDSGVDAVVLRIDSPGGSGLASELIWRQVQQLRQQKPVIVSMGATAASGGYYIACPADWILADPATVTGSIGVFALLFDASELWARLGVSQETISRGQMADLHSTFRGRTPAERDLLQQLIADFYQGFVQRVAAGRNLTPEEVDRVARGRVWTGRQALEHGLVDELGGLSRAVALASERLGLAADEQPRVVHLPRARLGLGRLLRELGLLAEQQTVLPAMVRSSLQQLVRLSAWSAEPVLALLPFHALRVQ